jgi:hypothetical protein
MPVMHNHFVPSVARKDVGPEINTFAQLWRHSKRIPSLLSVGNVARQHPGGEKSRNESDTRQRSSNYVRSNFHDWSLEGRC